MDDGIVVFSNRELLSPSSRHVFSMGTPSILSVYRSSRMISTAILAATISDPYVELDPLGFEGPRISPVG